MSTGHPEAPRLIADIGGTNARFALLAGDDTPRQERVLKGADYPDIVAAIEEYLGQVQAPRPREAAIAIANPVTGDWVKMTNHSWAFSIQETRRKLGLDRFLVINDFTALAMALPFLQPHEVRQVGGGQVRHGPIGLIGAGTGLGVSGLIPAGPDRWLPLQGEGGHVSFSPFNQRELDVLRVTWKRHPHVSAERLVSGMGLENLYAALCELDGKPAQRLTPADISQKGLSGEDPLCAEVLELFCALLGTASANLALTLGAVGGIYIGGGIVPRLGDYFDRSAFRARFQDKGRFSGYLAAIPTFAIQAGNPAFVGVAKVFSTYRAVLGELQH